MTPCCRPPSTRSRTLPRCPPRSPCIWTPAMTTDPAERHSTSAACTARSPSRGGGADPGRPALGRRADQLLAQRLRQAAPLHRAPPRLRRCLPRPGRRDRHPPCPASGRLVPLSLGHSTEITTHPLTYWRTPLGGQSPASDPSATWRCRSSTSWPRLPDVPSSTGGVGTGRMSRATEDDRAATARGAPLLARL